MNSKLSQTLSQKVKRLGEELGFQQVGITDTKLDRHYSHYKQWIEQNYHGEMTNMESNVAKRLHPDRMIPETLSVICVRLDYLIDEGDWPQKLLQSNELAFVSRYALGRDNHKLMRKRLQRFATDISTLVGEVLPHQPMRQWVLSFPFQLRFLFASRPELMGKVLGIVYRVFATHLIKKAGYSNKIARTGAVTLIRK